MSTFASLFFLLLLLVLPTTLIFTQNVEEPPAPSFPGEALATLDPSPEISPQSDLIGPLSDLTSPETKEAEKLVEAFFLRWSREGKVSTELLSPEDAATLTRRLPKLLPKWKIGSKIRIGKLLPRPFLSEILIEITPAGEALRVYLTKTGKGKGWKITDIEHLRSRSVEQTSSQRPHSSPS